MKYLIYNTEAEARERSLQGALTRGASPSTVTRYWWSWRETASNQWALCIPDSDTSGLSAEEQAALVDTVEFSSAEEVSL